MNRSLKAYLSSALTDVPSGARLDFNALQDRVKRICEGSSISLYLPREHSDPNEHRDIPADVVYAQDREKLANADLAICLLHFPSFGVGQELEIARNALIPLILVYPDEHRVSRMVLGMPTVVKEVSYRDYRELEVKLSAALNLLHDVMTERHEYLQHLFTTDFAENVATFRENAGLSRGELGALVGLPEREVAVLEESPDQVSNPSLMLVRRLASALGVAVADLTGHASPPTVDISIAAALDQPTTSPVVAARNSPTIPPEDARQLWIRIMMRVLSADRRVG